MIKILLSVISPDLDKMSDWLKVKRAASTEEFIGIFNENSYQYIARADNWAAFHNTKLSVSEVKAQILPGYADSSFSVSVVIDDIDIAGVAKAMNVPSPIAVIAASMGERGLTVSLNALLKINKHIISNEAVRQLKKRNMTAKGVYGEIISEKILSSVKE